MEFKAIRAVSFLHTSGLPFTASLDPLGCQTQAAGLGHFGPTSLTFPLGAFARAVGMEGGGCFWLDFADHHQRMLRCGRKEGSGSVSRIPSPLSQAKGVYTTKGRCKSPLLLAPCHAVVIHSR